MNNYKTSLYSLKKNTIHICTFDLYAPVFFQKKETKEADIRKISEASIWQRICITNNSCKSNRISFQLLHGSMMVWKNSFIILIATIKE